MPRTLFRRSNLGQTSLRGRSRAMDPMRAYDALPPPLRRWIAGAVMPWSPESCRRIWIEARARGETVEDTLSRLARAERRALDRAARRRPAGDQRSSTSVSP